MDQTAGSKLAAALVKFQAEAPKINKGKTAKVRSQRTGSEYTYRYADLGDILPAIQEKLAKHGLAWSSRPVIGISVRDMYQSVDGTGSMLRFPEPTLWYALIHESGEREEGHMPLGLRGDWTPQEFGSALTYARRYAMSAQLGLATEEDDDGKNASEKSTTRSTRPVAESPKAAGRALSASERRDLNRRAFKQGLTAQQYINAVRRVLGKDEVENESDGAATAALNREMSRFEAKNRAKLEREIDLLPGPMQRGQITIDDMTFATNEEKA